MGSGTRQSHHAAEPSTPGERTPLTGRYLRVLVTVYVLLVALVTAAYAIFNARRSQSWIVGEWLIDYAGAFVRRGLLGQVIVGVAGATHSSPVTLALLLQLLLYTGFYGCVALLAHSVRRPPSGWGLPLAALFFSPATLSFIPLNPPSSVRKEVLLLLTLAVLLLALREGLRRPLLLAILLTGAAAVCVLSHEGLVFYLPYLFAPVFLAASSEQTRIADGASQDGVAWPLRRAAWICLPAVIAAVLSAVAAASHPGSPAVASAICHSLGATMEGEGHGLCGGAIAYLAHDRAYARADVLRAARAYHYGLRYGVAGLLALAPVAWLFARLARQSRRDLVLLLAVTATAALGSVVLFVYARDWGRWIAIHATCLLLLFLFLATRDARRETASRAFAGPEPHRSAPHRSRGRRAASAIALVVYATCWNLPATGNYHAKWGYAGLIHYLRGYRTAPHHASSPP